MTGKCHSKLLQYNKTPLFVSGVGLAQEALGVAVQGDHGPLIDLGDPDQETEIVDGGHRHETEIDSDGGGGHGQETDDQGVGRGVGKYAEIK